MKTGSFKLIALIGKDGFLLGNFWLFTSYLLRVGNKFNLARDYY